MKKTKIVCTIGPSSWDPEVMRKMIDNGMNCARVNGAFADPGELDRVRDLVKGVSDKVSLMVDVKGPEIRLNKFAQPIAIEPGSKIEIGNDESSEIFPSNYTNLYTHLKPGQRMVIGDGDVEFVLDEVVGDVMKCTVVYGEQLKPGKALNLPSAELPTEVLTEKDKINLKHAIETGWDFVSASFIQNAEAAREVKKYLAGTHMKLIAKIEDQEGVDNIDEILEEVEGIMIARGGLGVELGLENVPMVQHYLTQKANEVGKPVITATQMLESMTYNPRPTRAEVNDVATAVMLGSDAVMLSGEASAGEYPVESVIQLTKISEAVECQIEPEIVESQAHGPLSTDSLTRAAAELCIHDEIDKVIVVSRTGRTARLLGRHNIQQPIYALLSADYYLRRMMLSKGVVDAFVLEKESADRDDAVNLVVEQIKKLGIVEKGENVLLISHNTKIGEEFYYPNIFEVVEID